MLLWRLSAKQNAESFNGGYGLLFDGRWNTVGHAVTYSATSPSLCVLEKLVHVEDPTLLPDLVMVTYDIPDTCGIDSIDLDGLPHDWPHREAWSQHKGDAWHRAKSNPLLKVPSAIVPLADSPDTNVLINHTHPAVGSITVHKLTPFTLDPRLF